MGRKLSVDEIARFLKSRRAPIYALCVLLIVEAVLVQFVVVGTIGTLVICLLLVPVMRWIAGKCLGRKYREPLIFWWVLVFGLAASLFVLGFIPGVPPLMCLWCNLKLALIPASLLWPLVFPALITQSLFTQSWIFFFGYIFNWLIGLPIVWYFLSWLLNHTYETRSKKFFIAILGIYTIGTMLVWVYVLPQIETGCVALHRKIGMRC